MKISSFPSEIVHTGFLNVDVRENVSGLSELSSVSHGHYSFTTHPYDSLSRGDVYPVKSPPRRGFRGGYPTPTVAMRIPIFFVFGVVNTRFLTVDVTSVGVICPFRVLARWQMLLLGNQSPPCTIDVVRSCMEERICCEE